VAPPRPPLDPVRRRLLELLRKNRTDLRNASLAIGRNPAYLHQFVTRGSPKVLPEEARERLARLLGVDDAALRHREPPNRRGRAPRDAAAGGAAAALHASAAPEPPALCAGPGGGGAPSSQVAAVAADAPLGGGFARVVELDVRTSAGPGAFHDDPEEASAAWLFPEAVVRHEFRARAEDLRLISVHGDSMAPLLAPGDRILVDTAQRVPVPPGLFVIWDGLGVVAKRVEHIPHSEPPRVLIRSVSADYQAYERDAGGVSIIGRVIWMARRL
jgi:hypothetical protein